MFKTKSYSLPEVFSSTNIGFIFEFYSSKDVNFIIENLSKLTAKNVILTNAISYDATFNQAILMKEYDGAKPRYTFQLAEQRYDSSITLMKEVLEWISETSECRNDNIMRVNMSFDHSHLKTLSTISQMNTQKLILKIDEGFIYERFPDQEDSPYCMSVKRVMPVSEIAYTQDLVKNINYTIGTPRESYSGISFKDLATDNLQFNYIGGEDYASRQKEILEVVNYYIIKTFQSLNEAEFTKEEIFQLEKMTSEFYKIQEAFYEPTRFPKLYPEIKIMVNMEMNEQVIKSYWPKIRNVLFETIVNNKMTKGQFNYDTDIAQYQLRHASINCSRISRFDLVKCKIQGIVENCNLIACDVYDARIYESKIVRSNKIDNSYLKGVTIDKENSISSCFVENNSEVLNCNISNSIIKFAGIGRSAKLDEGTIVIDKDYRFPEPAVGVEVEEIRDYNYIKNMNAKPDLGFQNKYIKPTYIK